MKEFFKQEPESETQEFDKDKIFDKPTRITDGNSKYFLLFVLFIVGALVVTFFIAMSDIATGEVTVRSTGPGWDIMEVLCLGVIAVFLLSIFAAYKGYEKYRQGKGPQESVQKLGLDD